MSHQITWKRACHALERRTFAVLVGAYICLFAWTFPATYGIDDESNILSLAIALSEGTPFLERAGIDLDADVEWRGHRISKFSPFHAALLVPAMLTDWRAGFLVAPSFLIAGAFVFRGMLRRSGLSDGWVALYFLDPGMLYYSRTLIAAVPAAVMGLIAASCLFRDRPRVAVAGLALGVAVLFHIWLAPVAVLLAGIWWIERTRCDVRCLAWLTMGALPPFLLLCAYNVLTTGHPLLNAYWITGHHRVFDGRHLGAFLPFYVFSLGIAPLGGWAALTRRWSGTLAIPIAAAVVVVIAASYYYRDGVGYGITGWVPGRRFLLPISILACLPSARFLANQFSHVRRGWGAAGRLAAIVVFCVGFGILASAHQRYLEAHRALQRTVARTIPDGARVIANDYAFKAFAPVNGRWVLRLVRGGEPPAAEDDPSAYRVWLGRPGEQPSPAWFASSTPRRFEIASWAWTGRLWVEAPSASAAGEFRAIGGARLVAQPEGSR